MYPCLRAQPFTQLTFEFTLAFFMTSWCDPAHCPSEITPVKVCMGAGFFFAGCAAWVFFVCDCCPCVCCPCARPCPAQEPISTAAVTNPKILFIPSPIRNSFLYRLPV